MLRLGDGSWEPWLVVAFGATLTVLALTHHGTEIGRIDGSSGPLLALALDGIPALGICYAGYRLTDTDLDTDAVRRVVAWCLAGSLVFVVTITLSATIRVFEGRTVSEPLFTLLLTAEAGAVAGLVAGYYRARVLVDKRRAERALDGLSFVTSIARHDLRNDLQTIDASAELITAVGSAEEAADRARAIRRSVADAQDRLVDTEAIAKTLNADAAFESVGLVGIATEAARRAGEVYGVTVETDLPDAAPVVGNEGLRSVVDNLVENAIEHNDREEPQVAVTVEHAGDTVRLAVRDDGPGLPPDARAVLAGTGADGPVGGLGIVRRLVEEYGGDLSVADNEPRGTVITVTLPAAERDHGDRVAHRSE
jgi:signal transduction histidine kinase